jgi:hypothetical protein
MTDDIPSLSDQQYEIVREFIQRHRDESEGRLSIGPILLVRVLASDKPAGHVDIEGETHPDFGDPHEYIHDLCTTLNLFHRRIKGVRGEVVSPSQWRLDLLPTTLSSTNAHHRRCGFVYGYPTDAICDFIETTTRVTNYDLVRAGIFDVEEIAYLTFVCYTYHNSLKRYEQRIERGKRVRCRIAQIADEWQLPVLDEYATMLQDDVVDAYRGNATWGVPTTFPPDKTVSESDVMSLLS